MTDFELVGHGPHTVICMHGWFGLANSWSPLRTTADPELCTFALFPCRGYGSRHREPGEHTIEGIGLDAVRLADELNWTTFDVAGHSMGGKAAQWLAARYPERVRRVVAIAPVPATGASFDPATADFFRSARDDAGARRAIIERSTGNTLPPELVDRMVARSFGDSSREAFAAYLDSWAFADFGTLMPDRPHELLVLLGDKDPDINSESTAATLLRYFARATVSSLPDCGHYPVLEQPDAAVSAIQEFLARPR